jgi:hypothetical protein
MITEAQSSSFKVGKAALKNPFLDTLRSGVSFKSYMAGLFSFDVVVRWISLVGRFKVFSTIYGEKCCLFFRHFSLKKAVKNSNLFHLF